jgi:hypothetical protein
MKMKSFVLLALIVCLVSVLAVQLHASTQAGVVKMPQNAPEKTLTKKQEQAAAFVFDDKLSDEVIAEKIGINRKTLHRWKQLPAFAARVSELAQKAREAIAAKGIALKQNRLDSLVDLHKRMEQVIEERAAAYSDAPGGKTGLLVRQVRFVKVYEAERAEEDAEAVGATEELEPQPHGGALRRRRRGDIVEAMKQCVEVADYAVDTGLLREMRETKKHIAVELGEWVEKRDVKTDAKQLLTELLGVKPEELPS